MRIAYFFQRKKISPFFSTRILCLTGVQVLLTTVKVVKQRKSYRGKVANIFVILLGCIFIDHVSV